MAFEAFCIVEIMGHQVIAGKVSEETHFGAPLMRVDVPKSSKRDSFTVYYGGGAIYKITPTTEEIVTAYVEKQEPEPIKPYMLALPMLAGHVQEQPDHTDYLSHYDPDLDDDGYGDYDDDADLDEDDPYDDDGDEGPSDAFPRDDDEEDELDKETSARRAKELLEKEFVILDLETTTTDFKNTDGDEIVQVAILSHAGETILSSYVKPSVPIPNSQYHGITDAMVEDAPSFPDLYERIKAALEDRIVIIYNADYDSKILRGVLRRHELPTIAFKEQHCAMLLYAAFHGEWNSYFGNYRFQRLSTAMAFLKRDWDGKEHDALADCKATLAVLKGMSEWHEPQLETSEPEKPGE